MIGEGVLSSETKSVVVLCGIGKVGVLSDVGDAGSDRMDDTERRFVRAGVRTVCMGGARELDEPVRRGGSSIVTSSCSSCSCSSSRTVSGWCWREEEAAGLAVEAISKWSPCTSLRIVISLGLRWWEAEG